MNLKLDNIGFYTIVILTAGAALIAGVFYLIKNYLIPFLKSRQTKERLRFTVFQLEVIIWTTYFMIGISLLIHDSLLTSLILLFLIALIGFNFWRNFFNGIIFKLQKNFEVKDPVQFDNHIGFIDRLTKTNIQIKTETDEIVYVPYFKLNGDLLIKRQVKGKLLSEKFKLNLVQGHETKAIQLVEFWLYSCPWTVNTKGNKVQFIDEKSILITLYAVDKATLLKAIDYIRRQVNSTELVNNFL